MILYEKCRHCHLFIESDGVAGYEHLHRGDDMDERLDADHAAESSGLIATLPTWRVYGPLKMRERFDDPQEGTP